MINRYLITIDTDWAPDPTIAGVSKHLLEDKVKSTWFIIHDSAEIRKLQQYPHFFELAIHPNFLEGSTQGKTSREVMSHLLKIVPEARSVRTHCLMRSTQLLKMIREEYTIMNDVSMLLPDAPTNLYKHYPLGALRKFLQANQALRIIRTEVHNCFFLAVRTVIPFSDLLILALGRLLNMDIWMTHGMYAVQARG